MSQLGEIPDLVIVGAGLAGLACSYALQGRRVCILERADRAGGRIETVNLDGFHFDLGACFAFERDAVAPGMAIDPGVMIKERSSIGISLNGRITYALSPTACLGKLPLDHETARHIHTFQSAQCDASSLRGTLAYQLLNALHHQVHPGEIDMYCDDHQRDGLENWYPDHWGQGNKTLVQAYINSGSAEHLNGCEVESIRECQDTVEVCYTQRGERKQLVGRTLVLATPAETSIRLLCQSGRVSAIMEGVRYARYSVVALAGATPRDLPEFRYIVIADRVLSMVMQQRSMDRNSAVLLCYYSDSACGKIERMGDSDLIRLTREQLVEAGLPEMSTNRLGNVYVRHWRVAGTVLSDGYLRARMSLPRRIGDRIFLAGDYLSPSTGVGYGMADAVSSGLKAGELVSACLNV